MKLHQFLRVIPLIFLSATTLPSHARVFKYEDQVNRVTIYSNMPAPPAPAETVLPKTGPSAPARESEFTSPQKRASGTNVIATPSGPDSHDYPRISPTRQKARDSERRAILSHELQLEQAALAEARSRNAPDEIIYRYKANIEALKRELAYVN